MTGVRYVTAIRTASNTASKQCEGVLAAMIGMGASPWRPYIACSRSACSVLVGRPVDGPPRWMSMISKGQLEADGQAHHLRLQVDARSRGRGDAERTAEGGAQGGADTGDLVLGLEGPHAELLVLGQLVEDVRGRGDRVGAEEQREAAPQRRGHQAPGRGRVPGDVGVLARLEDGRLHLVGRLEQLGRLAEVVAGLEGRGGWPPSPAPCRRTSRRSRGGSAPRAACRAS